MKLYYFAYGSNLEMEQMQIRCGDSKPVAPAELPGYRLVFRGVADIEESPQDSVTGALYEITMDDLRALDIYEGFPRLYIRKEVIVTVTNEHTGKEMKIPALVYQMTAKYLNSVSEPSYSYASTIERGYKHWNLNLDRFYHALLGTHQRNALKTGV